MSANLKDSLPEVVNDATSSVETTENYNGEEVASRGFRARGRHGDDDEEASVGSSAAEEVPGTKKQPWKSTLTLAFTSLGAIYGDLGTSPLYVLNSISYKNNPPTKNDIYGGVSVIFYLFTILVIFKYVCIVLFLGPNNGEGGQVAIYAKIARHLKMGPKGVRIPGAPEISDMELISRQDTTTSFRSNPSNAMKRIDNFKNNPTLLKIVQRFILVCCFIGCALVISDGLLTPTTSVLSAIGGIQIAKPDFANVLAVSEVILVALFVIQQFGSHKVSFTFAPIIFIWLIGLFICGIYNIVKFHPGIFRALSPYYAVELLKNGGIDVFSGAMLAITGVEAMFADIGHFGRLPIQLTLTCFVYPCLVICYLGQAAYIVERPEAYSSPFFLSLPGGTGSGPYWVMFVLSTLATIIASQALILSVFSIVSQLINLDCFPNVKVVHVSKEYVGKVYIPAVNWLLMIGVCATTAGFKNSNNVTAAYGLGITMDLLVTSFLITLCIIYVYNFHILWALLYVVAFIPLEILLVVSNLKKVTHGAWFPLMMAGITFIFFSIWRWGRSRKVDYEFRTRVKISSLFPRFQKAPIEINLNPATQHETNNDDKGSMEESLMVNTRYGTTKLITHDGIAIMYNDASMHNMNSPNTLPEVYERMISSFASIPSVFIFCSTRALSIPTVPTEERVLIASMKIPGHYRCIIRFGFMDEMIIDKDLSNYIVNSIPEVELLVQKYNGDTAKLTSDISTTLNQNLSSIPIVHIFENNLVRCHDYSSEEYKTRNPFRKLQRLVRKVLINHFFSPLNSITTHYGEFLKLDEQEEHLQKLFIGGVSRI